MRLFFVFFCSQEKYVKEDAELCCCQYRNRGHMTIDEQKLPEIPALYLQNMRVFFVSQDDHFFPYSYISDTFVFWNVRILIFHHRLDPYVLVDLSLISRGFPNLEKFIFGLQKFCLEDCDETAPITLQHIDLKDTLDSAAVSIVRWLRYGTPSVVFSAWGVSKLDEEYQHLFYLKLRGSNSVKIQCIVSDDCAVRALCEVS